MLTTLLIVLLAIPLAAMSVFVGGYLLRDTPVHEVRVRDGSRRLAAGDLRVRRLFEVLGKAALENGNRVEILDDGDELFSRLLADLRSARDLITWQVFWFKPGGLAERIAEALCERAANGVEVLVLLDYVGSMGLPGRYIEALRAGGVNVQVYRPLRLRTLYKFPHRSHVRSVVIDSRVGYSGGFGIDDRWLGDGRSPGHWRDTHVRIEGPAVDQLQAPFIANWSECTGELLFGKGVLESGEKLESGAKLESGEKLETGESRRSAGSHRAAVMYAAPSLGSTNAERFVALTIAAARETLYVTSAYFVPSRGFRALLCRAAASGVDVRILSPGGNTDQPAAWYAGRARYAELLRGGVRIYEYQPTMVHAKTFVADGVWLSVGSINFDNRSMKLNDEVALVAQDPALGGQLKDIFLRDLELAKEITLERFEQRSRFARLRERLAWLVSPLL